MVQSTESGCARTCLRCGEPLDAGATFCAACGGTCGGDVDQKRIAAEEEMARRTDKLAKLDKKLNTVKPWWMFWR